MGCLPSSGVTEWCLPCDRTHKQVKAGLTPAPQEEEEDMEPPLSSEGSWPGPELWLPEIPKDTEQLLAAGVPCEGTE